MRCCDSLCRYECDQFEIQWIDAARWFSIAHVSRPLLWDAVERNSRIHIAILCGQECQRASLAKANDCHLVMNASRSNVKAIENKPQNQWATPARGWQRAALCSCTHLCEKTRLQASTKYTLAAPLALSQSAACLMSSTACPKSSSDASCWTVQHSTTQASQWIVHCLVKLHTCSHTGRLRQDSISPRHASNVNR